MKFRRHVFTDLQPYICLHQDCMTADETFARWHHWVEHENHFHSKVWKCNLGCSQSFPSKNDMQDHFAALHGFKDDTDAHLLALSTQFLSETSKQQQCPLCHARASSPRLYYKHVAQHLEQLALFAISRDSLENEDTDTVEDDSNGDGEDRASDSLTRQDSSKERGSDELEVQAAQLGPENIAMLISMANLASMYMEQGRMKEAEELQVQILEMRKRVLGEEHPSTIVSIDNLASTDIVQDLKKGAD